MPSTTRLRVGRTRNELVASYWDSAKTKWRDFVRMTVADTLPETMPLFLTGAAKEIQRLLPKYKNVEKVDLSSCVIVQSFDAFAERLQRR